MDPNSRFSGLRTRASAWTLVVAMTTAPLAGCNRSEAPPPPVDDTRSGQITTDYNSATPSEPIQEPSQDMGRGRETEERAGLSGKQKVVMLAGAAALYYLYKKHKNAENATGPDGQYYLSKNGRVYYRDAEHRAHWVTPPPNGIAVPESEAAEYQEFQGYNHRSSGRDLTDLAQGEAH